MDACHKCVKLLFVNSQFKHVEYRKTLYEYHMNDHEKSLESRTNHAGIFQQPSNNFDDSGYFSVQVLATALRVWDLEFLPFNSSDAVAAAARTNPRY